MILTTGWKERGGAAARLRRILSRYGLIVLLVNAMALGPAAAAPLRILALGDSLTAGYGLSAEQSFPRQLERALRDRGHDVQVINAGVSGDTSAGGLARLDWVLADRPQVAILALGANDGLRGLDPAQTHANLAAIIRRLQSQGIPVLLAGMRAPPNLGRDYQTAFAGTFERLAAEHPVSFYPFLLDGVAAKPELNQEDGIHPNAAGVRVMVEAMLPFVERLLGAAG